MPYAPYIIYGTVYTSRGTVTGSVIDLDELRVFTENKGRYEFDLANREDGYDDGDSFDIIGRDIYDNEYVLDTITVSGEGGQNKDLYLVSRTDVNNQNRNSQTREIEIRSIGHKPITVDNPLPIRNLERPLTQKLAYTGSKVSYVGEANPGTPTSSAKWRIKRLSYDGDNTVAVEWSDGSTEFTKVWDSRATYDYA